MSFDFPERVAELAFERWADLPFGPGYQPAPRPPKPTLVALLNTCFFASLQREEGRTTQFDLALCPPSRLGEAAFRFSKFTRIFNLIRFDKKIKLSVKELVRLAPACDPEKTIILAEYDGTMDHLDLWGFANVDSRSGTSFDLEELRVRVLGPGEMKITLHGRALCAYKSGHKSEPERALINTGCIYDFFKETSFLLCREVKAATGQPVGGEPIHERDTWAIGYLLALQEIIERMQQLKHGGCILVVPEGASYQNLQNITIKYQCRDDTIWNCLCGRSILHDQFYPRFEAAEVNHSSAKDLVHLQSQMTDVENGLRDSLAALVRLTAVDGAVLMTRKFELLGFGTIIKLPQAAEYKVFSCQDRQASKPEEVALEKHGTRHRSAFEFCYRCAPSVAIVASQDGGLKLVTRVGGDVHFWENSPFDWTAEEEPWVK